MKKSEDVNVGDISYLYSSIDGFKPLGKIKYISKPVGILCPAYTFELDGDYPHRFRMPQNVFYSNLYIDYDNNWSDTVFIIVPDSNEEIDFLNKILKYQYKYVQSDIQNKLKNILGL